MLEITGQELRRCDLVKVRGRVDSDTAPELGRALHDIIKAGRFKIVLNVSGVSFMSSAGLRQLIDILKTCKRWNRGNLLLAEASPKLYEVLELAGLLSIFSVYKTEAEAVGSF